MLWINNLSGSTNQRTPSLMKNEEFELLVNVSQTQIGSIAHRLGSELFLDSVSADAEVRGMQRFRANDGTEHLHMVSGGKLYVNGASTWSTQQSSVWAANSDIDMINYIGRHFYASSLAGEWVKSSTESGSTTNLTIFSTTAAAGSTATTLVASESVFNIGMVGMTVFNTTDSASAVITGFTSDTSVTLDTSIGDTWDGDDIEMRIDGKYLAVNGAYMMIAGNSIFPRRSYFSNLDSDDINTGTDYFITSEPPTGITSFGNGRAFVIFTQDNYLIVDPATVYTNQVDGYGCVSQRSIQTLKGSIIFLDKNGFYLLSANTSFPTDISLPIKNDLGLDALFNKIAQGNLEVTASGVRDNRYYCAVRDLSASVKGQDLDSVILEYDISQNNWKAHTFTDGDLASVFAEFTDSTGTFLYGGSFTTGSVFKMEVPAVYTDENRSASANAVTAVIKTKHYPFYDSSMGAVSQKIAKRVHFRYYAASAITVSYAVDGSTTYTQIGTTSTLPAYTTTQWKWGFMDLGAECKSIGFKMSCSGQFVIYAMGIEVQVEDRLGISGS